MKTSRRFRRPGHATIVAYLALFAALSGGAYAATQINGKNLVDRSVAGKKIVQDALTGKEIKEATLGKVRSAALADRAGNVRRVDYRGTGTTTPVYKRLFSAGGMTAKVACTAGDFNLYNGLAVVVDSATGEANVVLTIGDAPAAAGATWRDNVHSDMTGLAFSPGDQRLFAPNLAVKKGFQQGEGQLTYRNAAHVITFVYHAFISDDGSNHPFCEVNGTAVAN